MSDRLMFKDRGEKQRVPYISSRLKQHSSVTGGRSLATERMGLEQLLKPLSC